MSLTYRLDDDLLRYEARGDIDYTTGLLVLKAGLDEVVATRAGRPTPVLFDIRESAESRGADELRGIAAVVGEYREAVGGQCAVVTKPGLYYGISRMFGVFVEDFGIEMRIFETVPEAESWLRDGSSG